jgi:hypothetical protein
MVNSVCHPRSASSSCLRCRFFGDSDVRAAEARLNSLGRQAETNHWSSPLAKVDDAQRMVGQLNQDANALAAAAAEAINDVLSTIVTRRRAVGEMVQTDGRSQRTRKRREMDGGNDNREDVGAPSAGNEPAKRPDESATVCSEIM